MDADGWVVARSVAAPEAEWADLDDRVTIGQQSELSRDRGEAVVDEVHQCWSVSGDAVRDAMTRELRLAKARLPHQSTFHA